MSGDEQTTRIEHDCESGQGDIRIYNDEFIVCRTCRVVVGYA